MLNGDQIHIVMAKLYEISKIQQKNLLPIPFLWCVYKPFEDTLLWHILAKLLKLSNKADRICRLRIHIDLSIYRFLSVWSNICSYKMFMNLITNRKPIRSHASHENGCGNTTSSYNIFFKIRTLDLNQSCFQYSKPPHFFHDIVCGWMRPFYTPQL